VRRNCIISCWFAATAVFIVCGTAGLALAVDAAKPDAPKQSRATAILAPVRMSLSEATAAVRKEIFQENPKMNPTAEFPLKELTTADVWKRLQAQVFVVTSGVREDQAYIVHDERVAPLGAGFGGNGVTSMCVADVNGDGKPKLVFSYSFGSGIHRSEIGIWAGGPSWIDASPVLREYDLALEKDDDRHVRVAYGEYTPQHGFKRQGEFGALHLSAAKKNPKVDPHFEIILAPKLPADVLNAVWK
jgi:hypothetical protein